MKIVKSVTVELTTENIKEAVTVWLNTQSTEVSFLGPWMKNNIELTIRNDPYDDLSVQDRISIKAIK